MSNRVAYDCITQMCVQWCADMCASVGDPSGIGGVEYGTAQTIAGTYPAWLTKISDWVAVGVEGDPPQVPVQSGQAIVEAEPVENGLATSGLIQVQDAMEIARDEINLLFAAYTAKLFPGRAGTYRKFCHWSRAKARSEVYYQECCEKLRLNCYSQKRKVRGVQIISTRRKGLVPGSTFKFAGKWAYYAGRGRPPLPPGVWLKRKLEREKARKKTSIVHKDRKPVSERKIPKTIRPRPHRQLKLARKSRPLPNKLPREESGESIPQIAIEEFIESFFGAVFDGFENLQNLPPD